ncbi:MAG TPA: hypothetical protein VGC96_07725 [Candidatus Elarobacter sp.]|jgi:hypothetical protein
MTIGDVVDPVMLPIAFAIAMAAALLLLRHVARRFPTIPARLPWRINADGRPSRTSSPKWTVWLSPAVLIGVLLLLGVITFGVDPPHEAKRLILALTFIVCAEAAAFAAWTIDRQIEIARKMTYRVAPARLFRACLSLLLTVAVLLFVAARP